jgi:hypothetical protein
MTRTTTLTDTLPALIESACDGVRDLLEVWFIENEDTDFPCLSNDLDYSGSVHQLIDITVPIWTSVLNELAYFHHEAALAALTDHFGAESLSGDWPRGPFAAGLYVLIEQGVSEWYDSDGEQLWDSWIEALNSPTIRRAAIAKASGQPDSTAHA